MYRRIIALLSAALAVGALAATPSAAAPYKPGHPTAPAIVTPTPGSTLTTEAVTFQWAAGASRYRLRIGTGPGRADVFDGRFDASQTEAGVGGLPLNGRTLYVELESRVGRRTVTSSARYTAPVRRALAVIADFTDARLEGWQEPPGWPRSPGFHNEAEIRATLDDMTAHWAWLSRGREKVKWDLVRVTVPRALVANPPNYGSGEFRAEVMASATVNRADYDVDADGVVDCVWIIASAQGVEGGVPGYEYLGGGTTRVDGVDSFVDTQDSLSVTNRTYGAFNHEFGHTAGLIDLYGRYSTVEQLSLMGNAVYQLPAPDLSAYDREQLGWMTPRVVSRSTRRVRLASANMTMAAVKVPTGWDGEYFLLEYRTTPTSGFGSGGPHLDGLAVYHVWTPSQSENTNPPAVTLEPADGAIVPGNGTTPQDTDLWYPGNPAMDLARPMRSYLDGQPVFRLANLHRTGSGMRFDVIMADHHPAQPANLVANPSMEAGSGAAADAWTPAVAGADTVAERSTEVAHSGQASLAISSPGPTFTQWYQTVPGTDPSRSYTACAWFRGESVTGYEGLQLGANLVQYGTWERRNAGFGTFDWTRQCLQLPASGSDSIPIACALGGFGDQASGQMWCDDVELWAPAAPPF